jgi:hypothetical protein
METANARFSFRLPQKLRASPLFIRAVRVDGCDNPATLA